ncbi:MAG: alpha/beta hydrolase [Deltaproteobacteria bacterium]|nr:alpha/beta hydrolase [Deltaproteobacteria bacterium]
METEENVVKITSRDDTELEGMLTPGHRDAGAVICHPHPQYGGSMHNNVVYAARDAFVEMGFWTLRFNFRGVGQSEGRFDGGAGEALDVAGACDYLLSETAAKKTQVAAYSFGSYAFAIAVSKGLENAAGALISPPVSFVDFSGLKLPAGRHLIVVGDRDDFCREPELSRWIDAQENGDALIEKVVLKNVDHFYGGAEHELQQVLGDFFAG